MRSAIITGASGQDGAYLARLLLEKGYKVYGTFRPGCKKQDNRLKSLGVDREIQRIELDLTEEESVNSLIRTTRVDEIYNLAAQSNVGLSWDRPGYTTEVNAMGVLRLLEALRMYAPETAFYQASSSEMYGKVQTKTQNENTPFHPRSPYGVSKTYGHHITVNYRESFGMRARSGILFNHESPLRGRNFVTRKITSGLAGLALGGKKPIQLGNLNAQRDWGFAGDYVMGIWQMMQQEQADDFVLATGVMITVRQFAEYAAGALGFEIEWCGEETDEVGADRKSGRRLIEVSRDLYRLADVDLVCGDASKARKHLGWTSSVSVQQLAEMMAAADYDLLKKEAA